MFWSNGMNHYNRYMKCASEVCEPVSKPVWTTANRVKLELKEVILREFSDDKKGEAIFIIPPQAGHHSSVADYDTGQSLVEAALKSGIASVYAAEWKDATLDRKDETIDSFILAMRKCIQAIGSKVTLIGLCQGGWQAAIYTALYPKDVKNLVLAAAPIDFHAGDSKITKYATLYPMAFYKSMVAMGNGVMDGRFLVTGFKMLNPMERYYNDYINMYMNIHDPKYVKRSRKFRNWYEYTQNIPGAFYLQIVKELFKDNKLIKGRVKILDRYVDLKKINHPLFLIAGDKDDITVQDQLFNIEKYVSSKDIVKLTVPAGHIGVFMGSNVIQNYWPGIFSSLGAVAH